MLPAAKKANLLSFYSEVNELLEFALLDNATVMLRHKIVFLFLFFLLLSSGEIIDFILTPSLSISVSKGLMKRQIN